MGLTKEKYFFRVLKESGIWYLCLGLFIGVFLLGLVFFTSIMFEGLR